MQEITTAQPDSRTPQFSKTDFPFIFLFQSTCFMSAADAALPALAAGPRPTVYLTSGCFVIECNWKRGNQTIPESQLKPDVQMKIANHEFFLGSLLVHERDENVLGFTEFFLYQVDCRAAFAMAPHWHSFVTRFAEA